MSHQTFIAVLLLFLAFAVGSYSLGSAPFMDLTGTLTVVALVVALIIVILVMKRRESDR
jgi:uncharacterized membrane protein